MKYLGYVLVLFGFADFGLSYMGTDLWGEIIGVQLPEAIWQYSGMIEAATGFGIVGLANRGGEDDDADG